MRPAALFLLYAMACGWLSTLAGCAAAPVVDAGAATGGGSGGGATWGAGGGSQAARDAGRTEGQPCAAVGDCASGLQCVTRVGASGARSVCSACQMAGTACGDGGRCLAVVQSSGSTVVCSFGAPGEPCSAPADCTSGFCDSRVTAAGVTTTCR